MPLTIKTNPIKMSQKFGFRSQGALQTKFLTIGFHILKYKVRKSEFTYILIEAHIANENQTFDSF